MRFTRPHEREDWIRLELSKLAAKRIRESPEIVAVGLERVRENLTRPGANPLRLKSVADWERLILKLSPAQIAAVLEMPGDEGQRLRSSMPFIQPPFFTEQERRQIIERAFKE